MNQVERFRKRFKDASQRLRTNAMAYNLISTLYNDFNTLFPPQVYDNRDQFQKLVLRFCHEKGCPICGSPTEVRQGKHGKFHGCSKYPDCKGIRKDNGDPSVNQALRDFLAGQLAMHGEEVAETPSRFTDLEL